MSAQNEPPLRTPILAAIEFLQELRKYDPGMPAHHAEALLVIARHGPISQQELIDRLCVSKSTVSRIYMKLKESPDGLGLITVRDSVRDSRRKLATLTPKGQAFVVRVFDVMGL